MGENELQRIVDALADEIGRSVAVNDPSLHVLCASRHFGEQDEVRVHAILQRVASTEAIRHLLDQGITMWTEPGIVPARPDLRMKARYCAPVRWRNTLLGLLTVINPDDSLSDEQVRTIGEAVSAMAAVLSRDTGANKGRAAEHEAALEGFLGPADAQRAVSRRALERNGWLKEARYAQVSVVDVIEAPDAEPAQVDTALRAALTSVTRGREQELSFFIRGNRAVMLYTTNRKCGDDEARRRAASARHDVHGFLGGSAWCVVGVGGPTRDIDQAWSSREQAETAVRGARLVAATGGIALWSELGVYRTLLAVPADHLTPALIPDGLRELTARDPHGTLVETLRAYLEHAGSSPSAASELHIHRTSLYYRLRQIENITRSDFSDGGVRLSFHLGLRLLELVEGPVPRPRTGHDAAVNSVFRQSEEPVSGNLDTRRS
ncbi:PucR family transcriptional regulator [Nocardiopsis nanhaiensis]